MTMPSSFNIVLVEPDAQFASTLAFALNSQFGATIFECDSASTAQAMFDQLSNIDVLIAAEKPLTGTSLLNHIGQFEKPIPVILYADTTVSDPSLLLDPRIMGIMVREKAMEEIPTILSKNFFPGGIESFLPLSDFCQIKPELLLGSAPLPADVYIGLSQEKYLKIFPKKSLFDTSDYNKYVLEKKVGFFFVKRTESFALLDRLKSRVKSVLDHEKIDMQAVSEITNGLQESIGNLIHTLGVTEEVQQMTEVQVSLILAVVKKNSNLQQIMERNRANEDKYIVNHSLLLSEVSCAFAAKLGWSSDSTFQKLVTAAIFHDMALVEPALARVRTKTELLASKDLLFIEGRDEVLTHPLRSAEFLLSVNESATDAQLIIKQHHERPDGLGFPPRTQTKLAPLSCLFIVAEDFVHYYEALSPEKRSNSIETFLESTKEEYAVGGFRSIWRELHDSAKG